jgi:hypothetical protein
MSRLPRVPRLGGPPPLDGVRYSFPSVASLMLPYLLAAPEADLLTY